MPKINIDDELLRTAHSVDEAMASQLLGRGRIRTQPIVTVSDARRSGGKRQCHGSMSLTVTMDRLGGRTLRQGINHRQPMKGGTAEKALGEAGYAENC